MKLDNGQIWPLQKKKAGRNQTAFEEYFQKELQERKK